MSYQKILSFSILLVIIMPFTNNTPEAYIIQTGDVSQPQTIEADEPIDWENKTIAFEHLSIEDGLSQSVVTTILQDHLGFMWFGTQDGLNRYDGNEFLVFSHDPDQPGSICNNYVQSLYEDQQGYLWIATFGGGLNRYDPKSEQFTCYQPDPTNPNSISHAAVSSIAQADDGSFWLGTNGGGLNHFDPASESFTAFRHDPNDPKSLSDDVVLQVVIDNNGKIWVGTMNGGLNLFDPNTGEFQRVKLFENIQSLQLDSHDRLWVGTFHSGLAWIDTKTQETMIFPPNPSTPQSPRDVNIHAIYEDQDGEVWIATSMNGFAHYDTQEQTFTHIMHDPASIDSLAMDNVTTIYQDRSGIYWLGTMGKGVDRFDPSRRKFPHIFHQPEDANSLIDNSVWSIFQDNQDNLWVGTFNGITKFNQNGTVKHYTNDPIDPNSINHNSVFSITQDQKGFLWIGNMYGLVRFDPSLEQFTNYPVSSFYRVLVDDEVIWAGTSGFGLAKFDPSQESFTFYSNEPGKDCGLTDNSVLSLLKDRQDQLWVGTFAGGVCQFNIDHERFTCFTHNPENPESLSNNTVLDIFETSEGSLWVATADGLNKVNPSTQTIKVYREKDGLPNNMVYAILPDSAGNLWLSTNKGLSKFNPENETFTNFSTYDGLQSNEFNQGARLINRFGEMFFGGINGLNRFFPADIVENSYQSPVVLTHMYLFNEPLKVGLDSHLSESLPLTHHISLSYQEKFFSFDFASLHFADPQRIQYAYQLVGLDEDWIYSGNRHYASYTNVPPGKYTFQVKATNCDGVWNQQMASIDIEIIPPIWQTLWFKILMILLGSALILAIFELRISMVRKQKEKLEIQVVERTRALNETMHELKRSKDAAEVANRAKSTFLANISHELRTPLNAILGFSQLMLNSSRSQKETENIITGENLENVKIIHDSGIHLLALINDVLEMSKIEAGRMTLRQSSFDLLALLKGLEDMFRLRAEEKNLTLSFEIQESVPQYINTDEGKLRQILLNLLGNAVKFTEKGSVILVASLRDSGESCEGENKPDNVVLQFDISDTGPGIAPQDMELIFKPFNQASSVKNSEGTGLGLSISKENAKLLGGDVTVTSQSGRGSTFSLILPVIETDQVDEDHRIKSYRLVSVVKSMYPIRILIVDDKIENRKLLKKLLAPLNFEVREAENGKTAVDIWQEWSPNIILMDMRMPTMDGYEATRQIKSTTKGQATVIIAVTASALEEDRELILSEGCDGYIRKPFHDFEIYNMLEKHLGIQILYEDEPVESPKTALDEVDFDYRTELSRLSSSQINNLHKAFSTGDISLISQLLDQFDKQSPQLRLRLKNLADQFKFDQVLNYLDGVKTSRESQTRLE